MKTVRKRKPLDPDFCAAANALNEHPEIQAAVWKLGDLLRRLPLDERVAMAVHVAIYIREGEQISADAERLAKPRT